MSTNDAALWDEVAEVLKWHNRSGHNCVDTINRLLAKHPAARKLAKHLRVQRESSSVCAESRSIETLWHLIHPKLVTRAAPHATNVPVVVLRFSGVEYLLDGRRRINYWNRTNEPGPHRVLVVCIPAKGASASRSA
jgi:hypothetical protein